MNRKNGLTLAALSMPLLLSVGCKSTECGCSSSHSSDSWTSWSPISWKTSEQTVGSCAPCESSTPVGKSTSGKFNDTYVPVSRPSNKVDKIVVPDDKPRPLPTGQS